MAANPVADNGLDISAISPRCGAKYSPNLYKWLTHKGATHRARLCHVYKDGDGTLWIGMLDGDYLSGTRLMSVLCRGTKEATMAYPLQTFGPFHEVDNFWSQYMLHGRCAIDVEHVISFIGDTRWSATASGHTCLWCGKKGLSFRAGVVGIRES